MNKAPWACNTDGCGNNRIGGCLGCYDHLTSSEAKTTITQLKSFLDDAHQRNGPLVQENKDLKIKLEAQTLLNQQLIKQMGNK